MDYPADTHVLIVGNGPAGLSLSAFLSGLQPYYNPDQPHPNPIIHHHLSKSDDSLLEQDLSWCDTLDEFDGTNRPLSVLYDSLVRPGADVGAQYPSCLQWDWDQKRAVPHIVVGETPVGGSWNDYDPQMLAVSFASWLDLPGYSISEYLTGTPLIPRLPSVLIAAYMEAYANHMDLRNSIRTNTRVTSIRKQGSLWVTKGINADGQEFTITSYKVVLASGKTLSRKLELENETECTKIVYDVPSLKARILHDTELGEHYTTGGSCSRVVVVGDGISSADVIRHCLERDIPILHVMRKNDRQLRSIMMSRLSSTHYSEYHRVYRLMTGKDVHPLYEKTTQSTVSEVNDETITIQTPTGPFKERLGLLAVCIGRVSDMGGILESKATFSGYRCDEDRSLFGVGSFAGDHFVRYLVGGCLEVARNIFDDVYENNNNNNSTPSCS